MSPYEQTRILDPEPDRGNLRRALKALTADFPAFAGCHVIEDWAGMIDVTPDIIPVISEIHEIAGLVVATGFSGHGFGIGPAAGHLAADLPSARSRLSIPWISA